MKDMHPVEIAIWVFIIDMVILVPTFIAAAWCVNHYPQNNFLWGSLMATISIYTWNLGNKITDYFVNKKEK